MINKKRYEIFQPLLLSGLISIGILIGYGLKDIPVSTGIQVVKSTETTKSIEEVLGLIETHFYEEINIEGLVDEAIYEIIDDLDDYSSYIPPSLRESHDLYAQGRYKGIGIETSLVDELLYISEVLPSGPAAREKVLKGSKIVRINNIPITENSWTIDSLSTYLYENGDDDIILAVEHIIYDSLLELTLIPGEVSLMNISDVYKLNDKTGYINLTRFGEGAYRDFMEGLEILLVNERLENLIIDVRYNPGGYLQEVCKIISQLLPQKIEFLTTIGKNGKKQSFVSTGRPFFTIDNIIVLVNGQSASASEILAGVLQDMDRGIIIGEKSFGKGLVQEQFNLTNGGVLRLSIGQYKLPSGRLIFHNNDGRLDMESFSARYSRKLSGRGGIAPDYIIPYESDLSELEIFKMAISELNQSRPEYDELDEFLSEYELSNQSEWNSEVVREVKLQMASILFADEDVRKSLILNDSHIKKAIDVLRTGDEWGVIKSSLKVEQE